MKKTILLALGCLPLLGSFTPAAQATCWQEASKRYNVPISLLQAIAFVESSNRARIVALNTNGSMDYGFMQINDFWLPELRKYHIGTAELMDACTSVNVGAWILAQNIQQMGYNWEAVGAYGAGTKKDKATARRKYAEKVWKALDRIQAAQPTTQREPTPSDIAPQARQAQPEKTDYQTKFTDNTTKTAENMMESGSYRIITSKTLKSENDLLAIE